MWIITSINDRVENRLDKFHQLKLKSNSQIATSRSELISKSIDGSNFYANQWMDRLLNHTLNNFRKALFRELMNQAETNHT